MSNEESFEDQNIVNRIGFYERELRLVLDGASVDEVFNKYERKRLRGQGILDYSHPRWFITDKAKEILCTLVRARETG